MVYRLPILNRQRRIQKFLKGGAPQLFAFEGGAPYGIWCLVKGNFKELIIFFFSKGGGGTAPPDHPLNPPMIGYTIEQNCLDVLHRVYKLTLGQLGQGLQFASLS